MSFKGGFVKSEVVDNDKPGFAAQFEPVRTFGTSNVNKET